jgi:hypothetical protein
MLPTIFRISAIPFLGQMLFELRLSKIATNVLQLGEVADLKALTFNLTLMFI